MSKQCWVSPSADILSSQTICFASSHSLKRPKYNLVRSPKKSCPFTCFLKVGFEDIAEIINNKVLIAAGASAAIGQLSKPFTSVILYGKNLDFRTAFQAGGFPSTHSSSVVAAATILALERGFSDSIFGLTAVYAGLIMYDAQGVRREVGNHAKVLNKLLSNAQFNARNDLIDSKPGEVRSLVTRLNKVSSSFLPESSNTSQAEMSDDVDIVKQNKQTVISSALASQVKEGEERPASSSYRYTNDLAPLKESIGHTEVEVLAGAFLGFLVSLAVYTLS